MIIKYIELSNFNIYAIYYREKNTLYYNTNCAYNANLIILR